MKNFEITIEGWHTGDRRVVIAQGEEIAETLMNQKRHYDRFEDGNWMVVGIRELREKGEISAEDEAVRRHPAYFTPAKNVAQRQANMANSALRQGFVEGAAWAATR
ncbi:hypothetical protein SEA_RIKSENGUPTA_68 [Microbacterium phage RikSengupta]|nr:hypothetical protein SEA_SPARCETUS_68 [Microbacterium phage Sparcetus]WMI33164.1 hypothetical protein SEA_RIKSENGUPTA_68 [Microbacterium phage RikSengupta]